jgi:hypothetical protein
MSQVPGIVAREWPTIDVWHGQVSPAPGSQVIDAFAWSPRLVWRERARCAEFDPPGCHPPDCGLQAQRHGQLVARGAQTDPHGKAVRAHATRTRCFLAMCLLGLLIVAGGASCQQMAQQAALPTPRVLPPHASREHVIAVVNQNTARLQTYYTTQATISSPMFPSVKASIAMERPRRFRLKAETAFTGPEVDLGSNDERFWYWVRRNSPPAVYFCRHEQFATSAARQLVPVEPEWLIEALGVTSFAANEQHQGPFQVGAGRLEIRSVRPSASGAGHKITVVDESAGWVLEQHLYDVRGQLVASATASAHQRDPVHGVTLPRHVDIYWPAQQMQLKIDIRELEVNTLGPNSAHLWEQPAYEGYANVDLADPNVVLPEPGRPVPPQPARAAGPHSVRGRPVGLQAPHFLAGAAQRGSNAVFGDADRRADLLVGFAFQVVQADDRRLGIIQFAQQPFDFFAVLQALFDVPVGSVASDRPGGRVRIEGTG